MFKYLFIPEVCPICGEKTIIKKDNDSEFLFCPNDACEGKFINKLEDIIVNIMTLLAIIIEGIILIPVITVYVIFRILHFVLVEIWMKD